jgi:aspartate-semialdehyde dehydrogenase
LTAPANDSAQKIAVTGAHDLVAGALLRLLAEREFPVESILALSDVVDGELEAPYWNDAPLGLELALEADLSGIDLLFLCPPCADAEALLERAVDAGARVIDMIGLERMEDESLLITPDLEPLPGANAVALPDGWRRVLRCPDPLALILATALLPLVRRAGLGSLRVQCLLPASILGEPGVRELAGQAENLFNQRDLPEALYGRQIAFNLLAGEAGPGTPMAPVQRDLTALLGDFDAPSDLRAIWVPVFFGAAATVWLETSEILAVEVVRDLLRTAPGLVLSDPSADDGPFPTPVEHALDSDAVHVALLGVDGASRRGHVLWVVADDVRRGRALNAVRIAECLLTLPLAH